MTTIGRHPVIYANFHQYNRGTEDGADPVTGNVNCRIEKVYRRPLLNQADEWVCAVERLEVPINAIPYFRTFTAVWEVAPVGTGGAVVNMQIPDTFGLPDLVAEMRFAYQSLNPALGGPGFPVTDLAGTPATTDMFRLGINPAGFFTLSFNAALSGFQNFTMPADVLARLGLTTTFNARKPFGVVDDFVPPIWQSATPRWDMGDDLDRLELVTTLPTTSDKADESTTQILTDFSVPSLVGTNVDRLANPQNDFELGTAESSTTWSPRQRVIYTPTERRFINMRTSVPINDLTLTLQYRSPDNTVRPVPLPTGGSFTVKLGFWSTKGAHHNRAKDLNSFVDERGFVRFR